MPDDRSVSPDRDYAVEILRIEVVEVVVQARNAKQAKAKARARDFDGDAAPCGESWWGGVRHARRM